MNPLLLEGLSDAIGFFVGALLGYTAGRLVGFDAMAAGYDGPAVVGIVLMGLGGGGGLQLARRWRRSRQACGKAGNAKQSRKE